MVSLGAVLKLRFDSAPYPSDDASPGELLPTSPRDLELLRRRRFVGVARRVGGTDLEAVLVARDLERQRRLTALEGLAVEAALEARALFGRGEGEADLALVGPLLRPLGDH